MKLRGSYGRKIITWKAKYSASFIKSKLELKGKNCQRFDDFAKVKPLKLL